MANTTMNGTTEYELSVLLKLDKLTGLTNFKKQLLGELNKLSDTIADEIDLNARFNFNGESVEAAIKAIQDYSKELKSAVAAIGTEGEDGTKTYTPDEKLKVSKIKALEKRLALYESALETRAVGKPDAVFTTDRFKRVLQDVTRGYYEDDAGKRVPITSASMSTLLGDKGPVDLQKHKLFTQDDIKNIRLYRQEMLGMADVLSGLERKLRSLGSKDVAPWLSPALKEEIEQLRSRARLLKDFSDKATTAPTKAQARKAIQEELAAAEELTQNRREQLIRQYRDMQRFRDRNAIEARKELRRELRDVGLHSKELIRLEEQRQKQLGRFKEQAKLKQASSEYRAMRNLSKRYVKEAGGIQGMTSIAKTGLANEGAVYQLKYLKDAIISTEKQLGSLAEGAKGKDKLKTQLEGYNRELDKAEKEALQLQARLRELRRPPKADTTRKSTPAAAETPKIPSAELGAQVFLKRGGFGAADRATRGELPELAAYAAAEIRKLEFAQSQLSSSSKTYAKDLGRMNRQLDLYQRELKRAQVRMSGFYGATNQAASLFRQFFRYALGYGALYQALQAVRALTSGLVDLETQLKSIQAVTAATGSEMRTIEGGIKQVALTTQFNTTEIAQAAQVLGQAGVIPKELPKAIEATALFASATGSSLQVAADLVTSMRNVFTTLDDNTISNMLTKAINISKLTAEDLKTVVSLSSQIAKSYNLSAEQYFAAVTTLRNAGIKPSTVATGLRQGLIELFSPDSKTVEALVTRYQQLGETLDAEAVRGKFFRFTLDSNPLISVLEELQRLGFEGAGKQVFQRSYDIRAENAIRALINDMDQLQRAESQLTFGNAAAIAATTQMEALSHSVKNLGAAISVFADDVVGGVLPTLEDWADGLTDLIQHYDDLHNRMVRATGMGLEAGATGGALGAVAGAALYRGQILGRLASTAVGGVVGAKLGTGYAEQRLPAEVKQEEGVPSGLVGHLKELGVLLLTALLPGVFRVIKNLYGGRGFIDAIMPSVMRAFGSLPGEVSLGIVGVLRRVSETMARLGAVGTAAGSAAAVTTGMKAWGIVMKGLSLLGSLLARHPWITGITAMYAVVQAASRFFNTKDSKKLEKKLDAATTIRERAQNNLEKIDQQAESFRFSEPETGYTAKPGTFAAGVEELEQLQADADVMIGNIFSNFAGKRADSIRQALVDLYRKAPEAGTKLRTDELDHLRFRFGRTNLIPEMDAAISRVSVQLAGQINRVEAIRADWVRNMMQLAETAEKDLSDIDKIRLDYLRKKLRENTEVAEIFRGTFEAGTEINTATQTRDILRQFEETTTELYRASAKRGESEQQILEARRLEVEVLVDRLEGLEPNSPEFQSAADRLFDGYTAVGQKGVDFLNKSADLVRGVADKISAGIREQIDLRLKEIQIKQNIAELKELASAGGVTKAYRDGINKAIVVREQELEEVQSRIKSEQEIEEQQRARDTTRKTKLDPLLERIEKEKVDLHEKELKSVEADRDRLLAFRALFEDNKENQSLLNSLTQLNPPGTTANRTQTQLRALSGIVEPGQKAVPVEKVIYLNEAGVRTVAPEYKEVFDQLAEIVSSMDQVRSRREQEDAYSTVPPAEIADAMNAAKYAVEKAESEKRYAELGADRPGNLYREYAFTQNRVLDYEKTQLKRKAEFGFPQPKEKERLETRIVEIDREKERNLNEAKIKIMQARNTTNEEYVRKLKGDLRDQIEAENRILSAQKKELAIAKDNGDVVRGRQLDAEIVATKERILQYRLEDLDLDKPTPKARENFEAAYREDMIPAFASSETVRAFAAGSRRQLDYRTPKEPRLAEDARQAGALKQLGVTPSVQAQGDALTARIEATKKEIKKYSDLERKQKSTAGISPETLRTTREELRAFNEELGELEKKRAQLNLSAQGFAEQFSIGFSSSELANGLRGLDSNFTKLGRTINNDIVQGLDQAADAFANALAHGESFAKGMRQALSDMAYQVAADIIKSGIVSMLATIAGYYFGGAAGGAAASSATSSGSSGSSGGWISSFFAAFGLAKGGVIEAKADGGIVGQRKDGGLIRSAADATAKFASGGVIQGPGSGTSDSIPGVVVNKQGKAIRGIKVSNGESILTAKTTSGLGKAGINKLNDMGTEALARLRTFLGAMSGYKAGGIISGAISAADFARISSAPPLAFAAGGTIGNMTSQLSKMDMPVTGQESSSHTYRAEVLVGAKEGSDVDPQALRRLDEGISLKIQSYIQEQQRPGGLLANTRVRAIGR